MNRLAGRVCLVTGSTGIAAASATRLAGEGATVFVTSRNEGHCRQLVEQIIARGGQGDDTVNASLTNSIGFLVFADGGADTVALEQIHAVHLGIHAGEGNDSVDVRDSAFAALGVALGDGDDTLTTADLRALVAILLGGEGQDTLEVISDNHFAHELIRGFEIPPDINTDGLPFGQRPLGRLLSRLR